MFTDHAQRRASYYVDGLTGLRGFAALWVLLYHAWFYSTPRLMTLAWGSSSLDLTPLFSAGWVGVDLFYTLSGFLLALPFAEAAVKGRGQPRLRSYLRRRVLRVFPAYYAQLVVLVAMAWVGAYGAVPAPGNLVAHAFMAHFISPSYAGSINGVWWTLPVEFSFYLILPLLALLLRGRRWPLLCAGAIGLTIGFRLAIFRSMRGQPLATMAWMMGQLPGRLDEFVFGMLAAYVLVRSQGWGTAGKGRGARFIGPVLIVLGLGGVVVFQYLIHVNFLAYWDGHPLLFIWHGSVGLCMASLIYGVATHCSLGRALFANKPMLTIGVISYSLYLWHAPLMDMLVSSPALARTEGYLLPWLLLLALPISLGLAAVSYFLFERPFLRWQGRGDPSPAFLAQPAAEEAFAS